MCVIRFRILFLSLFLIAATSIQAQETIPLNKEKLDTYLQKLAVADKFMGSVAIDSAGEEVYNRAFGYLSVENSMEANASTRYRVGSVTKMFTAVMIMQLVEEGRL